MILHVNISGRACAVDSTAAVDLARILAFPGHGPAWFGAEAARSSAFRAGGFIGDTRAGGSCNVLRLELIPHCQGTHTESFGHLCDTAPALPLLLRESLLPASLMTVSAARAADSPDTLPATALPGDRVLDSAAVRRPLATLAAGFHRALLIVCRGAARGDVEETGTGAMPPYFTPEAIRLLLAAGMEHLLVELPSLDRLEDGGLLKAHRAFWGLAPGSRQEPASEARGRTITELVTVPEGLADGPGLLELGVPPFDCDAAPSRPRFYPLLPDLPSGKEHR